MSRWILGLSKFICLTDLCKILSVTFNYLNRYCGDWDIKLKDSKYKNMIKNIYNQNKIW